jgi:dihydropteroate synthase
MLIVPYPIEKIKSCFDIPVSIDTYKHTVAENDIKSGADLINDIYGFRYNNGKMAQLGS